MLEHLPENWPQPSFLVLVGSRAYGLATPTSDHDYKGFYIAPSEDFWKFKVPNVQYQATGLGPDKNYDVTLWEIGKFLHLCLQGNPSVLEVLYGTVLAVEGPESEKIRIFRDAFLSKRVAAAYKGYAASQIHKSKRDIKLGKELRPKSLMHCLRLLLVGKGILEGESVRVHVGPYLELLQKVRAAEIPQEEVLQMCQDLFDEFDSIRDKSLLPEEPNKEKIEAFLLRIRKERIVNPKEER